MNRGIYFALILALNWQLPCSADDLLQGRIEQRNAPVRVSRPAMPSKPMGDALAQVASGSNKHSRSGFDLSASSVTSVLDKHAFDFNYHASAGQSDVPNKDLKLGADANDKELVVAWEEWHKRLCATIYHYWLIYGNIPGNGTVDLSVTRDGDIDFELHDYRVSPLEHFSGEQQDLFDRTVSQTLQMLDHTDVLTFPGRSKRKDVALSTKFSFTEQDDGPQGYTWKKGDYERVTESH